MQAQQKLFNKIVFYPKLKLKFPQLLFKVQSFDCALCCLAFLLPLFSFQGAIESRYTLKIEQCKISQKRLTLGSLWEWLPTCLLRKEVIQPLVLERLPCYDFTPITKPTFGRVLHIG